MHPQQLLIFIIFLKYFKNIIFVKKFKSLNKSYGPKCYYYISLCYYVEFLNIYIFLKFSFLIIQESFKILLKNEKIGWNVFVYFIFIRLITNQFTYFHNIFETLLCIHINFFIIIFNTKTLKIKHWLHMAHITVNMYLA